MVNKIFIDVGNTNFKIIKNNDFFVYKVQELNRFLSKLSPRNQYFFSCNNIDYYKTLKKLVGENNNIKIIEHDFFKNLLNFSSDINYLDVGIDILLQIYWFIYIKKNESGLIISSGTYLTCITIRNSEVISINIANSYKKTIKEFGKVIDEEIINEKYQFLGTNNFSAIFSSYLLQILGFITYNKTLVKNDNVIFTGLGFNNEILKLIKTNNLVKFNYIPNITLESLKRIYR